MKKKDKIISGEIDMLTGKVKNLKMAKNIPVEDQILHAIENDTMICGELDMSSGKPKIILPKK